MKVILNSSYRGPFRNAFGGTVKVFDLAPGVHELTVEEVEFLQRDAPGIFDVALVKKEVVAPVVNKMVGKGAGLMTKGERGQK